MSTANTSTTSSSVLLWRLVQAALLGGATTILVLLVVRPDLGLIALWDILIPAAPVLLVIGPGLWRNICPLGTVSQLPRHLGLAGQVKPNKTVRAWLAIGSTILLLTLVPARHVGLDDVGIVSAGTLIGAGLIALLLGTVFAGKSGWCSGLCPVLPVERLYGQNPVVTLENAHCATCIRCVEPCPDSTPAMNPLRTGTTRLERFVGILMAGGFAGFVWGWYQVKPITGETVSAQWFRAYAWPLGAMIVSLALFIMLRPLVGRGGRNTLDRCFAAGAVSIYYWYKLPALLGLGGSGTVLFDLGSLTPEWSIWVCRTITTASLFGWLVMHTPNRRGGSWLARPPRDPSLAKGQAFATVSIGQTETSTFS